jgi:TerC family integral membrane protein
LVEWYHWAVFLAGVVCLLAADLGVFHRDAHEVSLREALFSTGAWVLVALAFGGLVWLWLGGRSAGEFAAGYLIEWSLSADNVFVFILVFAHFAVPRTYQHRVLFWGVLGAIGLRLGFVLAGAALLEVFDWVIYAFGAILLVTAIRFLRPESDRPIEERLIVRAVRRALPMTGGYRGQHLVVREEGRVRATPLLAVLLVIEFADVVFAIDSIPAIFAITRTTFIVFSANALAILGLRSLYFVLSRAMTRFAHLRLALAALLTFVGLKMLLSDVVLIPAPVSLGVIAAILAAGVVSSLIAGTAPARRKPLPPPR